MSQQIRPVVNVFYVVAVSGTLAVHSPPGSGTVLTVRLPPGDPFG
jgi:signal transduction histidine kinase